MEIVLNGEKQTVPPGCTIAQLLETLHLQEKRLAVEVNVAVVPRSEHRRYRLQPGDRVEIVQAIGGG